MFGYGLWLLVLLVKFVCKNHHLSYLISLSCNILLWLYESNQYWESSLKVLLASGRPWGSGWEWEEHVSVLILMTWSTICCIYSTPYITSQFGAVVLGSSIQTSFFWWISALGWFLSITLKDKDFKVLPLLLPVFIVLSFYPSQLSYSSFRNMFSQIHLKLQSISCFFYVNRFISTWNFSFHPLNSFRSDFQFFLHSPLFLKTDKKLSMYFSKNGLEIKLL